MFLVAEYDALAIEKEVMQMADVRKIVLRSGEDSEETTEQDWSDTNVQVVDLFANKPDLKAVVLEFDGDESFQHKRYERL